MTVARAAGSPDCSASLMAMSTSSLKSSMKMWMVPPQVSPTAKASSSAMP
jgi:hypothetical protein